MNHQNKHNIRGKAKDSNTVMVLKDGQLTIHSTQCSCQGKEKLVSNE